MRLFARTQISISVGFNLLSHAETGWHASSLAEYGTTRLRSITSASAERLGEHARLVTGNIKKTSRHHYPITESPRTSPPAIISFMMSFVPSPIAIRGASRYSRSTFKSCE